LIAFPHLGANGIGYVAGSPGITGRQEVCDPGPQGQLDVRLRDPAVAGDAAPVSDRVGHLLAQLAAEQARHLWRDPAKAIRAPVGEEVLGARVARSLYGGSAAGSGVRLACGGYAAPHVLLPASVFCHVLSDPDRIPRLRPRYAEHSGGFRTSRRPLSFALA